MIDRLLGLTLTGGAFVVVLGIIIFVHELGHFLVAKLFRMRVFIFSFGFGKRLFGFKRGDTDYRVSLVPRAPCSRATAGTSWRGRAGSASWSTSPGR